MSAPVQDVATMPAGRELDALVAERVMGWCGHWNAPTGLRDRIWGGSAVGVCPDCGAYAYQKPFSTDLATAWQVVEKLRGPACRFSLYEPGGVPVPGFIFEAEFVVRGAYRSAYADAVPLAICRAALLAVTDQ